MVIETPVKAFPENIVSAGNISVQVYCPGLIMVSLKMKIDWSVWQ